MKQIIVLLLFLHIFVFANINQQSLLIKLKKNISKNLNISLFIDSDGDSNTGYSKNGIIGADFLIQNGAIFKRTSNSNRWNHWENIGKIKQNVSGKSLSFFLNDKVDIEKDAKLQAYKYNDDYIKATKLDIASVIFKKNQIIKNSSFLTLKKNTDGVLISSIKIENQNIIESGSRIFSLILRDLSTHKDQNINSLSGWRSVSLTDDTSCKTILFSEPKDTSLPKTLRVTVKIDIRDFRSAWDISVDGVGKNHSIVDIDMPTLRFKKLDYGKFLIPKYTGKIIDIENENINRDMLYPCGWTSTMQFLAYYNTTGGIYIGNHDPKASTKRFIVKEIDNIIEYTTKIVPPNKTLPNNNFKLSGIFELDSFKGDWYDASQIYRTWASKYAEYWPKMTKQRIKRQHKIGEVAVWIGSTYLSAIEDSSRSRESKDRHQKDYLQDIENMISKDIISRFPDVGIGFFWHEWYGKLHDTNFPSVFFPDKYTLLNVKKMIQKIRQKYPKFQFMPYINGLLYNKFLPKFENIYSSYALKDIKGNFFTYLPRGEMDKIFPQRQFVRMDPTSKPWQNLIADAANIATKSISSDGVNIDQVTASCPKEDMDKNHNHPLAGGHWWRDGYDSMFEKIDRKIDSKYVTSEGANEFLSDHIDGFFIHWDGVNGMVPAYQSVYSGKVQLFGLNMRTNIYNKNSFYMLYAQSFTNGIGLGIVTSWISQDKRDGASIAFSYLSDLAIMRYKLREFLSYGKMLRNINLKGNIPKLTDSIKDARASEEPDMIDGKIPITMSAIQHSVYKNELKDKVAFIFSNASRVDSVSFSFDIDGVLYGFKGKLKMKEIKSNSDKKVNYISNHFIKNVTLKPLDSVSFIISK